METVQTMKESSDCSTSYYIVFKKGERFMEELARFAQDKKIQGAHFTGLGAFSQAEFGCYHVPSKDYHRMHVKEQVELMSLIGNIGVYQNEIKIHAHVVLGKYDGTSAGGHLFEATICPTLELSLNVFKDPLRREMDSSVGLPLLCK